MKKSILATFFLLLLLPRIHAADSTTNYDDIQFPQWVKDLRRTEIITFGSLPFVTIWATLAYSEIKYGEFHNPLNKSADGFDTDDQKEIMKIAAASCLALGLTDLTITLVRRSLKNRKATRDRPPEAISITPHEEGDSSQEHPQDMKEARPAPPLDYLQGGIESAIF